MPTQDVLQPRDIHLTPLLFEPDFDACLKRLLTLFQPLVELVPVRIQLLEAVPGVKVELEITLVVQMNTARSAAREQPLAVVQIKRDQV